MGEDQLKPALAGWLAAHCYGGRAVTVPDLASPGMGNASQVWFAAPRLASAPDTVLDQLVIRQSRPEMPWYPDSDVGREFRVLQALYRTTDVPVPEPVAHEPDPAVLGAPFMVMRRVGGQVPEPAAGAPGPASYNASGWLFEMAATDRRHLWEGALAMLARVGRANPAPFAFLDRGNGQPPGLAQELAHWSAYLDWAAPTMPGLLTRARAWLAAHVPARREPGLSWGDARIGNMMFDGTACAFVIDWESASLGGAEMDLGWWLTMDQWFAGAMGLARLPGLGTREETVELWTRQMGRAPDGLAWHEVFGAMRLASIIERGLYLKGVQGSAANPVLPVLERALAAAAG